MSYKRLTNRYAERACFSTRRAEKAQQTQGILGKIAMALGFIAAIIMAPFNPVMAAIMIGGMVASLVIPKIADEIMKAAGVDEKRVVWSKWG